MACCPTPRVATTPSEVRMKRFSCGDVVSGCTASFVGDSDDEILALVGQHRLIPL